MKYLGLVISFVIFFGTIINSNAQSENNYLKYYKEANSQFKRGNYQIAIDNYTIVKLYKNIPDDVDFKIQKAKRCQSALDSIPKLLKVGMYDAARLEIANLIQNNSYDNKAKYYNLKIKQILIRQNTNMIYISGKKLKSGEIIKDFFIMKHEVTVKQYCEFLNSELPSQEDILRWIDLNNNSQIIVENKHYIPKAKLDNYPVVNVSWYGAKAYALHYGYDLPLSWEWDLVAFSALKENHNLHEYSWLKSNSQNKLHPVAKQAPSTYGLYDLYGNAWEWTSDCYNNSGIYFGSCFNRKIIGGSFRTDFNRLEQFSSYQRNETMLETIGFRCVKRFDETVLSKRPSFKSENESYAKRSPR